MPSGGPLGVLSKEESPDMLSTSLWHFLGQPAGIVFYWHELDLKLSVAKFQHRVPDILLAVIFGTPQATNIDKMAAVWKRPMPFDTSMCCGDDIRLVFARQTFQECRGGS